MIDLEDRWKIAFGFLNFKWREEGRNCETSGLAFPRVLGLVARHHNAWPRILRKIVFDA